MATEKSPRPSTDAAAAAKAGRALILASFLTSVGFSFVFPLLPLYVRELSGPGAATALWSGFALAATPMGGAVVSPFWGKLADRVGHRPMLLRALICTMVTIGLTALPNAPWQLVVLRVLTGALGSFQAAAMGALASWSRPEDLARALSRLQMASVFGMMVGPLVGGLLAAFFGIRLSCVAAAAVLGLGTILVARWFHEPAERRARLRGPAAPLRPTLLWLPMLTLVAVQFTDASFNPILPLLLAQSGQDAGMVAALSGLAVSLSAAAAAGGAALAGRAFKRGVGRRAMMATISLVTLLAAGAMLAPLPWELLVVRILCGGIVAGIAIGAYSAGGLAAEPSQRGSAYGWLSSSSMVGYAASPIAAGALAAIDLRAVLVVDTALCLTAIVGWGWSGWGAKVPARSAPLMLPTPAAVPPESPPEAVGATPLSAAPGGAVALTPVEGTALPTSGGTDPADASDGMATSGRGE